MSADKMKVPLILEQFALTEFAFKLVETDEQAALEPGRLSMNYGLSHLKLPAPHKLVLKVGFGFRQGDARFEVKASIVGFFKAPEGMKDVDRDALLKRNGLTMLYGALRGLVLPFSGAFPPGVRCVLPTVNMAQVVEDAERESRKVQVREEPAKYEKARPPRPAPARKASGEPAKTSKRKSS